MSLAALVAASHHTRLAAVRTLRDSDTLRFALRRVLFTDDHAEVRAAAARRLAAMPDVEPWLVDALPDTSPLVRDAILRALARAGTTACTPHLRHLVSDDRMWWVRRGAVYALAAIAGEAEVATFTRALADPFWRVRHAAVKVLAVLGAASPALRDEVIASSTDTTTLAFLRASWGPVALEAPQRAAASTTLPAALLDPDPAVVTARLLASRDFPPLALVELLCDPHVPLRSLAAHRLATSQDREALTAALDWLEEPRIPHVVDTVTYLLDGLGDLAAELAALALARPDRRGAARWAIGWAIATHDTSLYPAALARAHADPALRLHVLRIASHVELAAWAAVDPCLADAVAVELHERRRTPAAADALLSLDATHHPRIRALQLDVHARRGDAATVARGLTDPHHAPRAVATRWAHARHSPSDDHLGPSTDADPAVREAALTPTTAAAVFAAELDPFVRRAAAALLGADTPRTIMHAALADEDPWIRARACTLPLTDDPSIVRVLGLLADRDPQVRSAALDALGVAGTAIDARVRAITAGEVAGTSDLARRIAHAWSARDLDMLQAVATHDAVDVNAAPIEALAAAPIDASIDTPIDVSADHVDGVPDGDTWHVEAPHAAASPARSQPVEWQDLDRAPVERRPFGRAGFDVAPLVVSGAYDLPVTGLAAAEAAGVDLYFWEPGYDVLGSWLRQRGRRDRLRVVTGSYHADAPSVRLDVERALRKLRRETLDAFLLFWTRSPARIDDEAYRVLDDMRREGKIRAIGFSTHHRDLARSAIEQTPWDVVMIRHSAAHPGIERELLAVARATRTAIVTFSALCYGRMLSGAGAPSASECYRYSLAQPGVTACISAPRRYRELVENLAALRAPHLAEERIAALRAHGLGVHAESARFNALVRQPTRDAAAAAREMLAAELPPEAEPQVRDAREIRGKLPRASEAKRSRTRLGSIRRGR